MQALGGAAEADLPTSNALTLDASTDAGKRAKACNNRNNIAMANFTMSFATQQLLGLIYKAQTTDWPGGLAHLVVTALKKKYQPVNTMSLVEMRHAVAAVSMKKDDDPSSLFEQISGIDNRFQNAALTMLDEEKIATILMAAPKKYITLLTAEQRQKGVNLKLDDLQEAMLARWRQTHNSTEQSEESEIGLTAFT
jgi:hypothetical protein